MSPYFHLFRPHLMCRSNPTMRSFLMLQKTPMSLRYHLSHLFLYFLKTHLYPCFPMSLKYLCFLKNPM
jgi:hypothetical protein